MRARYWIVPSQVNDIYALAATLRAQDAAEVTILGGEPRAVLRKCFRNGIMRKTAFVESNGRTEIAAMWGLCGVVLSDVGEPYLLTAPAVERVPFAMLREARAAVADMLRIRTMLVGNVAASYTQACRFLELVGFTLATPRPIGACGGLFREFRIER